MSTQPLELHADWKYPASGSAPPRTVIAVVVDISRTTGPSFPAAASFSLVFR